MLVNARFKSGRWEIRIRRETFTVDSAAMYVAYRDGDVYVGQIVQSHGLDMDVATRLDRDTLRDLGVGGPRNLYRPRGRLAQLTSAGEVQFET